MARDVMRGAAASSGARRPASCDAQSETRGWDHLMWARNFLMKNEGSSCFGDGARNCEACHSRDDSILMRNIAALWRSSTTEQCCFFHQQNLSSKENLRRISVDKLISKLRKTRSHEVNRNHTQVVGLFHPGCGLYSGPAQVNGR